MRICVLGNALFDLHAVIVTNNQCLVLLLFLLLLLLLLCLLFALSHYVIGDSCDTSPLVGLRKL